MKIVIAPDSFKESLTAKQVCNAIETGLKRVFVNAEYISVPVADGGEGTVQSMVDATQGRLIHKRVTGPLGEPVDALYGILGDNQTAIIEVAAASGLALVATNQRDPMKTSSYGTGQLIEAALDNGINKFIIGLGGSATNDGGIGLLEAIGVKFFDKNNQELATNGSSLCKIHRIDTTKLDPRFTKSSFLIACDVDNPLCGLQGASAIFGPQKGASSKDIEQLDIGLLHYSQLLEKQFHINLKDIPGTGAAGGIAVALLAFSNAQMKKGINIVLDRVKLREHLQSADIVFTGEGCIDQQTAYGKTPMGVAQLAKQFNLPVIAIAGCLEGNYQTVYNNGIDAVFASTPKAMPLQDAFKYAEKNIANTAENIARILLTKQMTLANSSCNYRFINEMK